MKNIRKVSTVGMPKDTWLGLRRGSIGGSDAGTVLGLNPYSSPYALWAEKTGKLIPADISDKEAVRLGNDLEQYVADRFSKATGKKIRRCNAILYNEDYPFAHANPDRLIAAEPAGLECKTTSSWEILEQCRNGDFPKQWYCQIMHYMMVTGYEKWYLAVLVFGQGFFWFEITRNESEIKALAAAEEAFWTGNVLTDIPPAVDGTDATQEAIKTIFADSADEKTDLTAVSDAVYAYIACSKQIKELETLKKQSQAQIQTFMQTAERGELPGVAGVTWRPQRRSSFDRESYEKDHGPVDGKYFTVTESRTFRLTNKNK